MAQTFGARTKMARLTLRLDFDGERAVGPGKVRLLEEVERTGSIAAGGRAMGMSYRRAWLLVEEMNRCFKHPVVTTQLGGSGGGGAQLTLFGRQVVAHYRAMEREAAEAAARHIEALRRALARQRKRRSLATGI
jgi:molybdate transport system regulatory protein